MRYIVIETASILTNNKYEKHSLFSKKFQTGAAMVRPETFKTNPDEVYDTKLDNIFIIHWDTNTKRRDSKPYILGTCLDNRRGYIRPRRGFNIHGDPQIM